MLANRLTNEEEQKKQWFSSCRCSHYSLTTVTLIVASKPDNAESPARAAPSRSCDCEPHPKEIRRLTSSTNQMVGKTLVHQSDFGSLQPRSEVFGPSWGQGSSCSTPPPTTRSRKRSGDSCAPALVTSSRVHIRDPDAEGCGQPATTTSPPPGYTNPAARLT